MTSHTQPSLPPRPPTRWPRSPVRSGRTGTEHRGQGPKGSTVSLCSPRGGRKDDFPRLRLRVWGLHLLKILIKAQQDPSCSVHIPANLGKTEAPGHNDHCKLMLLTPAPMPGTSFSRERSHCPQLPQSVPTGPRSQCSTDQAHGPLYYPAAPPTSAH